jgi:hypothetical protein
MIDEKKLIEELTSLLTSSEMMGYLSAFDVVQDCIEIVEKQPKTDWIPCEERLPEDFTDVLIVTKSGRIDVARLDYNFLGKYGWCFFNTFTEEMDYVIAWQPLPAPYKKEGVE